MNCEHANNSDQMYSLFVPSLPKGFPLLNSEHSACPLRRLLSLSIIDQTENMGCCKLNHILMSCLQQSIYIVPTPLRVWKDEWTVYVAMKQTLWILESRASYATSISLIIQSLSSPTPYTWACKQHSAPYLYIYIRCPPGQVFNSKPCNKDKKTKDL